MDKSYKKHEKDTKRKEFRRIRNLALILDKNDKQVPIVKAMSGFEIPLEYASGDLNPTEFGFLQVTGHNLLGLVYNNIQECDAVGVSSQIKFDYDKEGGDRMIGFTITLHGVLFYADNDDEISEESPEINDDLPPEDNEVY